MSQFVLPKDLGAKDQESSRLISFEGITNCRDLGGYGTEDGRVTKWGVAYRSDSLTALTEADATHFGALGLRAVVDFRSDYEKELDDYDLRPEWGINRFDLPIGGEMARMLIDQFVSGDISGINLPELLPTVHRKFVRDYNGQYRSFMNVAVKGGNLPILFHDAAGKDRAGFAAAILLRTLGVHLSTIIEDYMLTNTARDSYLISRVNQIASMQGEELAQELRHFILARQDALMAAFDTIDYEYGSFSGYVRNGLMLTAEEVDELKSNFLD